MKLNINHFWYPTRTFYMQLALFIRNSHFSYATRTFHAKLALNMCNSHFTCATRTLHVQLALLICNSHFWFATRIFDLQLALLMLKMQIASWFLRVAIFDFYQKVHIQGSTDSSFWRCTKKSEKISDFFA